MTMTIYHLNILSNSVVIDSLNYGNHEGKKGWSAHPLFEMHADISTLGDAKQAIKAYLDGHYKAVAIIGDEDARLQDAFQLTNHIDKPWVENEQVSVLGGPSQRSTSVGDIIDHDGMLYMVAGVGFTPLGEETDLVESV